MLCVHYSGQIYIRWNRKLEFLPEAEVVRSWPNSVWTSPYRSVFIPEIFIVLAQTICSTFNFPPIRLTCHFCTLPKSKSLRNVNISPLLIMLLNSCINSCIHLYLGVYRTFAIKLKAIQETNFRKVVIKCTFTKFKYLLLKLWFMHIGIILPT